MTQFSALIERLEKAPGPDRELDADIFRAIGLTDKQERHCTEWCRMAGRTDLTRDRYIAAWAPAFTRSIDDAFTLVPECPKPWPGLVPNPHLWVVIEREWRRKFGDDKIYPHFKAGLHDNGAERCWEGGSPVNLPIALSIAALRARAEG